MILTRRRFILMSGSALAGGVFVPKFERWFKWLPRYYGRSTLDLFELQPVKFAMGFTVSAELLEDDLYGRFKYDPTEWIHHIDKGTFMYVGSKTLPSVRESSHSPIIQSAAVVSDWTPRRL